MSLNRSVGEVATSTKGTSLPVAVSPQAVPENVALDHRSLYFNRELSWLDFNWRVLYQALDPRTPLLERARFLEISENNLDEFFAKRVGGLKSQVVAGLKLLSPDGRTAGEQLDLIRDAVVQMRLRMDQAWEQEIRPALKQSAGVEIVDWAGLEASERDELTAFFRSSIYPILTPLAVDPGHPFPFISNLSLSLAITLVHPERRSEHFARVKLPLSRGRWVPVGTTGKRFIAIEQVIAEHAGELFRGMEVRGISMFRVTRASELERGGDAEDLLQMMSEELRERRFAQVVRLEVEQSMPEHLRELLLSELELHPNDLYETSGLLDLHSMSTFAELDLPGLHFEPWEPVVPAALVGHTDIFAAIRACDLLVHHPYESFAATVERFIEQASVDPRVVAIKQTLYRISDDSRVAKALIRAAEEGKQVAVLVEVTASLDEERNIEWAQRMEKAGVHVTYGVVGLKTHTKITLVVRDDGDAIRAYCHIGTGNYHERTARLYTDLGLFTAAPDVGKDVVNLFHYLTGFAPAQKYTNLLIAPRDLRRRLEALIEREIAHGSKGRIILKMNGLDDVGMVQALYRAAAAGVQIDLIVRSHTRLRPGLPGVSDTIRVISLLGRFLEHDRILYFHNDADPSVFIGSADWRRRNLVERVEAMVRIDDPMLQRRLLQTLEDAMADNRLAWDLHPDGRWVLRRPPGDGPEHDFQRLLMERALKSRIPGKKTARNDQKRKR